MEMVSLVVGAIRKGDVIFSADLKDAHFQIPIHPETLPYLWFALNGKVFQFEPLCFVFSTASRGCSPWCWRGLQKRDSSSVLPGLLGSHSRVKPFPLGTSRPPLYLCQDRGCCYQVGGKSELELTLWVQYLGILMGTI